MKKYIPLLALLLVIIVAAFLYYRNQTRREYEQRIQADIVQQKRIAFVEDSISSSNSNSSKEATDLLVLHAGDTVLVSACNKPFFIKHNGITSAEGGSDLVKKHLTIRDASPDKFEMAFSCAATEKLNVYPIEFTTAQGNKIAIYFLPTPDLNSTLRYYTNFEISM